MKLLLRYLFKYKGLFSLRIISKILVVFSMLAFDFMMGIIIDTFSSGNSQHFKAISILTFSLIIFMFISEIIDSVIMTKYTKKTMDSLRCDIFSKIIRKDIKDFSLDNSGKYISILYNDLNLIEINFINNIFIIISSLISFVISTTVLFFISPTIVIFIIIVGILGFIIPNSISKKLILEKNNYSNNLESIMSTTKDLFTGFEVIKGFNISDKVLKIFNKKSSAVEESKRKYGVIEGLIRAFAISFGSTIYLGVLILGGYLMYSGNITVGTAIIIIQLSTHIVSPIKLSINLINQVKSVSLIGDKIEEILNSKVSDIEDIKLLEFNDSIKLKNIEYSYTDERKVLDNVSLEFEKNKKYVVVGESGSGKSTLIKLIMRYFNDYDGEILIDNKDIKKIYSEDLYKNMSMIMQNVFMFDDTIKENIKLFSNYSDEEVLNSCDKSGIMNLINRLDLGINSLVGENGNNLSGGEKQRIAIARALINKTKILILDESTSALDNETAYNLESNLVKIEDLTMIVITHKLIKSILEQYDEIIVMKYGSIIEKGSFDYLIKKKGYFYSLYIIQNEKI
ncbi:MAG: ABC transporter ATP-binding protein [Peptostreptococcaceae bacterium]